MRRNWNLYIVLGILYFVLNTKTVKASEEVFYIHQDHLGSNSVITKDGTKVSETKYYPYGSSRYIEQGTGNSQITEKGYTGQISDSNETGLLYYNARYYDPSLAIFTQADPVKQMQNGYNYVASNPINSTDPTGHYRDYFGEPERNDKDDYAFPWDDPKYSSDPMMDPMHAWINENPMVPFELLKNQNFDYSQYDMESIAGDYQWIQSMVQFNKGLVDDPFGGNLGKLAAGEAITNIPYAVGGVKGIWDALGSLVLYKGIQNYDGGDILPGGLAPSGNTNSKNYTYQTGRGVVDDGPLASGVANHSLLGFTEHSPYSSWTNRISVARKYAGENGTIVASEFAPNEVMRVTDIINPDSRWTPTNLYETFNGDWELIHTAYHNLNNSAKSEFLYRGIVPAASIWIVNR